ncbi:MAG: glucoamylase family protein [Candidatus Melainabacteria bacterium]|nr:glucoamylase family protein [Candidatus Melainabacteria bacterium]
MPSDIARTLLLEHDADEAPLHSELFSLEQMYRHGKAFAASHKLATGGEPYRILDRLDDNEHILTTISAQLTKVVESNERITPAAEWLLDNFYLIEEQIRLARRHLPKGYSRELPRLANGSTPGIPRVYELALSAISHGDGRVDPENLSRFINAYQEVAELKMGELWAFPIMLRLAVIENLRRISLRIAKQMDERNQADVWADKMLDVSLNDPKNLILVIADMARSNPPMVSSFVAEITRRLQGQSSALALSLNWIEQRLSETGTTIEQMVLTETQQQASMQLSISNSIGSLRILGSMDWRKFMEEHSLVERVLLQDPTNVYGAMDFGTRDQYRHVLEKIAKDFGIAEGDLARSALELSKSSCKHIGYYILDAGIKELKNRVKPGTGNNITIPPIVMYVGSIISITLFLTASLTKYAQVHYLTSMPYWLLISIAIILIIGLSQFAVALVNWLATLFITSKALPKMDFSNGIASNARTIVVVPTMLSNESAVESLMEALEVRFLANRDQNLYFALLTDFPDAATQTLPQDNKILELAKKGIEELNNKYEAQEDFFFLFHRPRLWNEQEKTWMAYERKRGKLSALNELLQKGTSDKFSLIAGDVSVLKDIKFVITLDTDTQLPRDCARQLAGTMAHPLNEYGILQPRVSVSLPRHQSTLYSNLYSSNAGIDPYTKTVSDVYQDIFAEGSFIGKGIYDIEIFEAKLKNRLPENHVLSHDLLEGCFARSGLVSDIELFEEYPTTYMADVMRQHRWIRGDWQLLHWLAPTISLEDGKKTLNPLSPLSHWKIFDNLRRSFVPIALTVNFIIGWICLSPSWLWTAVSLAIVFLPPILFSLLDILRKPNDMVTSQHLVSAGSAAGTRLTEAAFNFACLPFEASYCLDAILRTLYRLYFSHRNLLAWNPSNLASASFSSTNLNHIANKMLAAPFISTAVGAYLVSYRPDSLPIALPILAIWFLSPLLAWWMSLPLTKDKVVLSNSQKQFLRILSRKTWYFFETFVGPRDNYLPPDNYQELPVSVVAHRTSPTNIGLSLLASLTAYDFGYITKSLLVGRLQNILTTMQKLERHRGHLYNWYDTISLKPLPPIYISTVDSGNLAGHLLTLKMGLFTLVDEPFDQKRLFHGLEDTCFVLLELVEKTTEIAPLQKFVAELSELVSGPDLSPLNLYSALGSLETLGIEICFAVGTYPSEIREWANALKNQVTTINDELLFYVPKANLKDKTDFPTLKEVARDATSESNQKARNLIDSIEQLTLMCADFANIEYDFLFDKGRKLLAIGYNVDDRRLDASFYDLLASEARLCNFVAIAQGKLPQESWFALGRLLTTAGGEQVLFSWSGSMFEYLMPLLVMPTYDNTLLDQTYKASVRRQIEYGRRRSVPWGISESGYYAVDVNLNYQYRAFGVPGLGLKRGLAQDLVIAPYATALALMVFPKESCSNLERLKEEGFIGSYGLFEAIDYTPSRIQRGQNYSIVHSWMAHHQGMAFLSFAHALLDKPMHRRFESEASFQSTALLLQERIPKTSVFHSQTIDNSEHRMSVSTEESPLRIFNTPHTPGPEVQLLSNGKYHVMVTNSGGGYSRWRDIAVTRWREDSTRDNWGSFCYIRDLSTKEYWSASYQPTLKKPDSYEAVFSEARVEFKRRDYDFDTHTEIVVSSEDDIELRRVRITNRSRQKKIIDLTTYAEVTMVASIADDLHSAFSNLFVQTEIIRERQAIVCTRRPRSENETPPWMFHQISIPGSDANDTTYETDRLKFIGRTRTCANPIVMEANGVLSGSEGSVLDPVVAIRRTITLKPEESITVNIVTGIAETRAGCLSLVEKYQDKHLSDRVFDLAWTHSQVVLRQLNASESDGQLYARLASSVIYSSRALRADSGVIIKNRRGQSGLWGYAISGDLPIVLLRIKDSENIDLVRQLVQAHAYWRLKGLPVDLVIWNEDQAGYRQLIQDQIMGLIASGIEANLVDKPGGIFLRATEHISNEDKILFQVVARAIISDTKGALQDQIMGHAWRDVQVPRFVPSRSQRYDSTPKESIDRSDLILFNGTGGFTNDGREYVITTGLEHVTPAPWCNVIANPYFGTVVSESGLGYTWLENAHEFRLSPWYNDPVSDTPGEAIYIRDEETGHFWSCTPLPATGKTRYSSRHGFGYTVFEHQEEGIATELWVYVSIDAPVKFMALKVHNRSGRARKLSATSYVEWVLGDLRPKTAMHISSEIDPKSGALFSRNRYSSEFSERVAFLDVDDTTRSLTADRTEFIGRNRSLSNPAALHRTRLSGRVGSGLDPCAAMQVAFDLADGQEREIVFRMGIAQNTDDATRLLTRYRGSNSRNQAFIDLCEYWKHTLGAVNVQTPDPAVNMLANGWLIYQTISCRLWGRSGYYQSGGAFGFRDQLQDCMALIYAEAPLLRKQLLLAASRQFPEGDVQHWWHPPSGRGVRTHISDDYLWLPLAVCRYVMTTGDTGVLDEIAPFLSGRPVNPHDESYYDLPGRSDESVNLYEHCKRAINHGLRMGEHGLPLMGCGDWNDGMNKVGEQGKGESVWLGFFLCEVLRRFQKICELRGDTKFKTLCQNELSKLKSNIDRNGWDGRWYRRAYFDNGMPLGSSTNEECKIDSISQSWSLLSAAGTKDKTEMALESLYDNLVKKDAGIIQLLDPPFDKSDLNPGYIKGYVPGVRENGGQYTHGAIWAIMAFASQGKNERAWELFSMINPINHARNQEEVNKYKVEPYVVAADVYGAEPHIGRGGWTWYTGSSAWMYRLIMESLLGLRLKTNRLSFAPCLPKDWKDIRIHYRFRETVYHITMILNSGGKKSVVVDGVEQSDNLVHLVDDRQYHEVRVTI